MALGVIPPLCATLGPVLAGPEGCSRGRWRSGPSKWRHTAAPEGRGQGAPRTCRCIETSGVLALVVHGAVREHHAPVGALRLALHRRPEGLIVGQGAPRTCRCIETRSCRRRLRERSSVREHHAPVGALRQNLAPGQRSVARQGAPRTCRCIETSVSRPRRDPLLCQGAPRTCRCIETRGQAVHADVDVASGSTTHL